MIVEAVRRWGLNNAASDEIDVSYMRQAACNYFIFKCLFCHNILDGIAFHLILFNINIKAISDRSACIVYNCINT